MSPSPSAGMISGRQIVVSGRIAMRNHKFAIG